MLYTTVKRKGCRWNVRRTINLVPIKTAWHIYPLSLRLAAWRSIQSVSRTAEGIWCVRCLDSTSATAIWFDRNYFRVPIKVIFQRLKLIPISISTTFNNREIASTSRSISWKLHQRMRTRKIIDHWSAAAIVNLSHVVHWRTLANPSSQTSASHWMTRQTVAKSISTHWSEFKIVGGRTAAEWNVAKINVQRVTTWKASAPVSLSAGVVFNTRTTCSRTQSCIWHDRWVLWWSRSVRYRIHPAMFFIRNKSTAQPRFARGGFLPNMTAATLGTKSKKQLGLR